MIPYSELQEALRISSMRELEDLLIDTIYAGVVRGHLDHRNHCLHAQGVLGRDVPAQSHAIDDMIHKLESWCVPRRVGLPAGVPGASHRVLRVAKCDEIIATVQSSRAQTLRVVSDHRDAESAMAVSAAAPLPRRGEVPRHRHRPRPVRHTWPSLRRASRKR